MPDDLYHPPVMHLYFDDLIADTTDLSNEELGAYVRLMHRQWNTGAIPADPAKAGSIAQGTPRAKMKRVLESIGKRLKPHPSMVGAIFSPRMEEVREQQRAHAALQSERGKAGAAARERNRLLRQSQGQLENNLSSPQDEHKDKPGTSIPISDLQDRSPSARDSAGARTRETLVDTPAYKFCLWLLREGIERGAIPGHHGQDEYAWCYRHLDDAITLVENYGADEPKIRGERLIAAKVKRTVRRDVTPRTLLDSWDWDDIRGVHSLPRNGEAAPAVEDGVISAWRAREQRDA